MGALIGGHPNAQLQDGSTAFTKVAHVQVKEPIVDPNWIDACIASKAADPSNLTESLST
jgi:hypothetical protein